MGVWTLEVSAPYGMSLLVFINAGLLNRREPRKNWGYFAGIKQKEKVRESEPPIENKGNLSHSALYCDLNLLEVRPKR